MKIWGRGGGGGGNKGASKHACSINEDLLIRSISNLNEYTYGPISHEVKATRR